MHARTHAQDHYDWKLRAVKTTLNVAGGMRRQSPTLSEDKVLLRALRDFNLGKLVPDDVDIFVGLINDLFPKTMELVPRVQVSSCNLWRTLLVRMG